VLQRNKNVGTGKLERIPLELNHLSFVMRGLEPRIQLLRRRWIAGSSPAMTIEIQFEREPL
jgi:hypothetical protein